MVQKQIVLAAVAEQQSHDGIQPVQMYGGSVQPTQRVRNQRTRGGGGGAGMAELHFPAVVTPLSTYFHHSPDLLLPPRSHNWLKINSEARPVPESNGTLAAVVAGQFVSRTFSVKQSISTSSEVFKGYGTLGREREKQTTSLPDNSWDLKVVPLCDFSSEDHMCSH